MAAETVNTVFAGSISRSERLKGSSVPLCEAVRQRVCGVSLSVVWDSLWILGKEVVKRVLL